MAQVRVPLASVPDGGAVRVEGVCVVRIGADVHAIADRCSHANVSLSEGDVDAEERTVECWKHGSAFSLLDGQPQSLPAVAPVAVYQVKVEGDDVVVEL